MEHLAGQSILVTGGSGFLGRAVCRAALAAGARVHALHRRSVPADPDDQVVRLRADLADLDAVRQVLERVRPSVVVHAAGYANASRDVGQARPSLHDNLVATVNLLTAAKEFDTSVVLSGSIETPHGHGDIGAVTPNSPYAASKFAEACYGRMFHRLYGMNVVIARLSVIYGPGEARPAKLIPHVLSRLLSDEPAEMTSGRRRIDWLYIDDAAQGVLACAGKPHLAGMTVDIGSGVLTSVANVATALASLAGRPELLRLGAKPDRPDEVEYAADLAGTVRSVGWRPTVQLTEGLRRTVEWFRQHRSQVVRDQVKPLLSLFPVQSSSAGMMIASALAQFGSFA